MKKRLIDLQLFDDEGSEGTGAKGNGSGAAEVLDFDGFLKDPKNQAEFDKRVAKALNTQKAKLEEETNAKIETAKSEAEKLAKMNAEQKQQYEQDQLAKKYADLEAKYARIELTGVASNILKEKEIDATPDILDLVVGADAEATKKNIDKLAAVIEAQLKAAEIKRAKGNTPRSYKQEGGQLTEIQKRITKYKK